MLFAAGHDVERSDDGRVDDVDCDKATVGEEAVGVGLVAVAGHRHIDPCAVHREASPRVFRVVRARYANGPSGHRRARREVEGIEETICTDHVHPVPTAVEHGSRRDAVGLAARRRHGAADLALPEHLAVLARKRGHRARIRRRVDDVLDRIPDADVLGVERRRDEAAADVRAPALLDVRDRCWTRGRPRPSRARSS